MPSKKKVKDNVTPVEGKVLLDPVYKKYILFAPDVTYSTAICTNGRVTIVHGENSSTQLIDTGNGYCLHDISPKGAVTYNLDYSVTADLFAALKIFYHNADKVNGEYWTVFEGDKI